MDGSFKKSLLAGIGFGIAFIVLLILICTADVKEIGPEGTKVGLAAVNGFFAKTIGFHMFWYRVTQVLGGISILTAGLFALLGLYQLIRKKDIRKVDKTILALGVLYAAVVVLYVLFDHIPVNYRPVILDEGPEPSFPSTHTMISCCVMGSTILVSGHFFLDVKMKKAVCIAAGVIMVLTVVGRMLSGVHWFTDIIGGILISCALLALFQAALFAIRAGEHKKAVRG